MSIHVSNHLRKRLKNNEIDGYLRIAKVEPHPQAKEVIKEIDVDKNFESTSELISKSEGGL